MRILCSADLHLGKATHGLPDQQYGNTRLRDMDDALGQVWKQAADLKPEASHVVFLGDVFDSRVPSLPAIATAMRHISDAIVGGPTHILVGNHDTRSRVWDIIRHGCRPLYFHDKPDTRTSIVGGPTLAFAPDKASLEALVAKGVKPGTVLFAHVGIREAMGYIPHDLPAPEEAVPVDLIRQHFSAAVLGHAHKRQVLSLQPWIGYAGSLMQLSFAEEGQDKAAFVLDIGDDGRVEEVKLLPVVTPEFRTCKTAGEAAEAVAAGFRPEMVRVKTEKPLTAEERAALPPGVAVIVPPASAQARDEGLTENLEAAEALERWLRMKGFGEDDIRRLTRL